MPANNLTPLPSSGKVVTTLITDLCIECATRSARLAVRSHERPPAVAWVLVLLTNPRTQPEHFHQVRTLFGEVPIPTAPWPRFPPEATEPSARAIEMAQGGPEAFTDEELAYLLLDANALADLAHLVEDLMPDWWLDALAEDGRQYETMVAIELGEQEMKPEVADDEDDVTADELEELLATAREMGPKSTKPEYAGPTSWTLKLPDEVMQRIARVASGNPAEPFTLRLHRIHNGRAELEMSPVPRKSDVMLLVTFRTGDERTFVIEVPTEAKVPGADPEDFRPSTRSTACDPLPDAAFHTPNH
jgi:hypothetical protein